MESNFRSTVRVQGFSSNVIDKDVQSMLLPLNLMQILILNPNYHLKNNFISPNTLMNKLILVCGAVLFIAVHLYRITQLLFDENMRRYQTINFIYFATCFECIFSCIGFIMNFILHLVKTKDNVTFILTFQEVHRCLSNEASGNMFVARNWIHVSILFGSYLVMCIYNYIVYLQPPWYVMLYLVSFIILDFNLVYAISLIKLLTDKVVLWNAQVLVLPQNDWHEIRCRRMFQAYDEIINCFNIIKDVFQQPVIFVAADIFLYSLIRLQVLIEFLKYLSKYTENRETHFVQASIYFFIIKSLTLETTLCLHVEAFYDALKNSKDSCARVLASNNCTDEEKKLCKNVQRLYHAKFSKMTACGLFQVDIGHPLHLIGLLANYTFVLLQFAFL